MLFRARIGLLAVALLLAVVPAATAAEPPGAHGDDFGGGTPVAVPAPEVPATTTRTATAQQRTVSPGPRDVAVILVNFTDDTRQPWTPEWADERVFASLNAFYTEESYGAVSFDGDVFGWYTVDPPDADCSLTAMTNAAGAAAEAQGAVLAGYDHVMFIFPRTERCAFAGRAVVNGRHSWINGTLSTRVLVHEMGHNLGVHHAAAFECKQDGTPVALSPSCVAHEYGDPFSVMGGTTRHNHAWHLQQLGFAPASKVQTITETGTYTVGSAADPAAERVALRIPRLRNEAGVPLDYFYLDVRTSWGTAFDAFSSADPAVNGVTIRLNPEPSLVRQSYLIDAMPGPIGGVDRGFADAPLPLGETFTDQAVSITTTSVANGVATVAVVVGPPPADTQPPTTPQNLAAVPSGAGIYVTWSPSTGGVAGYRVFRDGLLLATTTNQSWFDLAATPGTTHTYAVAAFDAAGNESPRVTTTAGLPAPPEETVERAATEVESEPTPPPAAEPTPPAPEVVPPRVVDERPVVPTPADTLRPRVRVTVKRIGRGSRVRIRATATDDRSAPRLELWIDGVRRRLTNGVWTGRLKRLRTRRHVVVVKAFDAAGNEGRARTRIR